MLLLGGEIRAVDGYVLVCNESVPDPEYAHRVLAAVDLALEKSGHRAVLFDTRDMPAPPEEVNAILREWVDTAKWHDKVALLVKSDLKLIASNMRALAAKVKLRSFHDLGEAEKWLRAPVPISRAGSRPITEPLEIPRPDTAPAAAQRPAVGDRRAIGKPRPEAKPDANKPSEETQPRFVWRSALLREYLGD